MKKWRIENNVPIPPEHGGKGYAATIRKLKKGQSVLLPTNRKNLGGIRIWRIKK